MPRSAARRPPCGLCSAALPLVPLRHALTRAALSDVWALCSALCAAFRLCLVWAMRRAAQPRAVRAAGTRGFRSSAPLLCFARARLTCGADGRDVIVTALRLCCTAPQSFPAPLLALRSASPASRACVAPGASPPPPRYRRAAYLYGGAAFCQRFRASGGFCVHRGG